MSDSVCISKLGVSFDMHTVYSMRWFAAELPKRENNILMWGVIRDQDKNRLQIILAADPTPSPGAIEDEVDGIQFYWVGEQKDIDMIRNNYCMDYDRNQRKIKLMPKES